jgi:Tol biopolymer transport system component
LKQKQILPGLEAFAGYHHGIFIFPSASFSPDGQWIVFQFDRSGNLEIYIMQTDGSEVTQITTGGANDYYAVWRP